MYYHDWIPNTFYAKSASDAWFQQGLTYVVLFFQSYWILPAALLMAGGIRFFVQKDGSLVDPDLISCIQNIVHKHEITEKIQFIRKCLIRALHAFLKHTDITVLTIWIMYVMYVGGDFMFARFLLPAFILVMVRIEKFIAMAYNPKKKLVVALFLAFGMLFRYNPFAQRFALNGITEEYKIYTSSAREKLKEASLLTAPYMRETKPVVAFYGAQAALIYYWDIPVAIESETGLTDHYIARQSLKERGRIGHEKQAPAAYLKRRHVSFALHAPAPGSAESLEIQGLPGKFEIIEKTPELQRLVREGVVTIVSNR
jgi:hypothetical protein